MDTQVLEVSQALEMVHGLITADNSVIKGLDIGGFSNDGIDLTTIGGNVVQGDYLGTDVTGTMALANGNVGIRIEGGSSNNQIGGTMVQERNIISGNGSAGVQIQDSGSNGNVVEGNYIGTDVTGTLAVPNNIGLNVQTIGATTTGNSIEGNSIYDNTGLGIDLGDEGVTPNGSSPIGPNNLENYPVLNEAFAGTQTSISGTLNSLPSTTFTVDFYSDSVADPSGHGQGQTDLGSTVVTTDSNGNASSLTAGNGGDILIDGTTDYDTNAAALAAILASWDNTSLTYAQREAALLTGVSYGDGQTASLVADSTVNSSPGANPSTLTGGNGQDLFFATVSDTIKNKSGKTVYYF